MLRLCPTTSTGRLRSCPPLTPAFLSGAGEGIVGNAPIPQDPQGPLQPRSQPHRRLPHGEGRLPATR